MIHGFFLDPDENEGALPQPVGAHPALGRPSTRPGVALFGGMGMPSDPSVAHINPGGANTNIVHHAGKLMALQE